MISKLIFIFFYLINFQIFAIYIQNTTICFCNTTKCPRLGYNYLLLEESNTNITYFYIQQDNGKFVVSNASTILSYKSLDTGTSTNKCVEQYSYSLNDFNNTKVDAGHILAKRLGGIGTQPLNIFPQNYSINRGEYAQFENEIYYFIKDHKFDLIQLTWQFYYKTKNNTRPYQIKYSYYNKTKIFSN